VDELFRQLLAWIGANPGWTYLIVFMVALAESLAFVGMLVPGVMIMIGAGALIGTGSLAFWPTALSAIAGAVLGDGFSYWLGHHYRERIRGWWPFNRHPQPLDRGTAFFARHGGKSVAFGRFVGPGRAIIPLVAGMMRMPPTRFLAANVSSGIAWGPAYLAPGIVFGASLKLAAEAAARLAILLLILGTLLWLAAWSARRLFLMISPHANAWLASLLRWAAVHPRIGHIAQALADPSHPDARTLAALAVALLTATLTFGLMLGAVLFGPPDMSLNTIARDLGQSLHTPLADQLMAALNRLGGAPVLLTLVLVVGAHLLWRRRRRDVGYWLAAAAFLMFAIPLLGWLLAVPRPDIGLGLGWPWSFPSAPVLGATLVYGFLAVILSRGLNGHWRWVPYACASILVAAIAAARLYFGAEWLTDVLGSIALGLAWISALGIAFRRHTAAAADPGLAGIAALAFAVSFGADSLTRHEDQIARLTPTRPIQALSLAQWRTGALDAQLPRRRLDLWRSDDHAIDIQYAGRLDAFTAALTSQGWQPAERLGWYNAMKLLSPSTPLAELPVIPHVHDGRDEALALVKDPSPEHRLVIRLWSTPYRLDGDLPLWVGDATSLSKDDVLDLIALPVTIASHDVARRALADDLRDAPGLWADQRFGVLRIEAAPGE
jgi:membrane protein DedA with SNARE-associated domain/membrane-associated phospholipid phosphatase